MIGDWCYDHWPDRDTRLAQEGWGLDLPAPSIGTPKNSRYQLPLVASPAAPDREKASPTVSTNHLSLLTSYLSLLDIPGLFHHALGCILIQLHRLLY